MGRSDMVEVPNPKTLTKSVDMRKVIRVKWHALVELRGTETRKVVSFTSDSTVPETAMSEFNRLYGRAYVCLQVSARPFDEPD